MIEYAMKEAGAGRSRIVRQWSEVGPHQCEMGLRRVIRDAELKRARLCGDTHSEPLSHADTTARSQQPVTLEQARAKTRLLQAELSR
jgi:hypothetical protein